MSANSYTSISDTPAVPGSVPVRARWRSLAVALIAAAALIAVCGAINWLVDPFNRLGRNQLGVYSSSERDAKPQMIRRYPHDGIIIGTSRVANIDPLLIHGYTLFDAAFSDAMPEEILNFLRVFAVGQKLVIIGLDFLMFNERESPLNFSTFRDLTPINAELAAPTFKTVKRARDYLLSWNVFVSSLKTILANTTVRREPPFLLPAGNRNFQSKNYSGPVIDYSETLNYWRTHTLFDFRYSQERLEILRSIKALLQERKIPYIIFINPENERLMDLIRTVGLYPLNLRFRRDVRDIFPDLVDLSESKWKAVDYYRKKDPGHYFPEIGAEMVNEMIAARPDLRPDGRDARDIGNVYHDFLRMGQ
jgi:hypothetical protein